MVEILQTATFRRFLRINFGYIFKKKPPLLAEVKDF